MLTLETLNENYVKGRLNRTILQQAEPYLKQLTMAERRGRKLCATFHDSFEVETGVELGELWATCNCPDDWSGFCKHIAAVLLKWVRQPHTFRQVVEPDTAYMLDGLEVIPIAHPPSHTPDKPPEWIQFTWAARQTHQSQAFAQYLEQFKMQELRDLADGLGWTLKGNTKAALVSQMMSLLTEPDNIRQSVDSFNQEHRQVLWAVALMRESTMVTGDAILSLAKHWGPIKQYKKVDNYFFHLREKGLTMPGHFSSYYHPADFVPGVLMRPLSVLLAEQLPEAQETPFVPVSQHNHPADVGALLQAISQLMLLWQNKPPALRPQQPRPTLERLYQSLKAWGYVPQELIQAHKQKQFVYPKAKDIVLTVPAPELTLPDDVTQPLAGIIGNAEYLHFVYHLMLKVGLFQPGDPVTIWSEVKNQFLHLSAAQQQSVLLHAYRNITTWQEVDLLLRAKPELQLKRQGVNARFKPEHLQEQWLLARQQTLRVLACLPDDRWITWESMAPLFRQLWPSFDSTSWGRNIQYYTDMNPFHWHFTYKGQRVELAQWDVLQGEIIRRLITGPLHWLGLADVFTPEGKLVAFRLHGLGDLFWDRTETVSQVAAARPSPKVAPVAAAAIQITDENIRVNPAHVSHQGHRFLEQIAKLAQAEPTHFLYRLDIERVHHTFEAGHTLTELQQGWQEHLRTAIPKAIDKQLRHWWENYGQVRLYEQVSLIELADDYALAEMKAVTSLNQHIIAELSPRLVLIPKNTIETLQAELQKAGYTPKVEEQ